MRRALVTGGNAGIGAAIVRRLATDGWQVVATGFRRADALHAIAQETGARAVICDLSDPTAPDRLVDDVLAHEGGVEALVNCAAGLEGGPDGGMTDSLRDMVTVNLTAPIALMDRMRSVMAPGSAIVNISSLNAARPPVGAAVYTATKGGLDSATAAFAREFGPLGIRVNAIAPGMIEKAESPRSPEMVATVIAQTPLGRAGIPDDIAGAVAFFLSADAAFITGQVLAVTGGYRL